MENYLLLKESPDLLKLSSNLGYSATFFLSRDFVYLKDQDKKRLLRQTEQAHQKKMKVIYEPVSEELLRYALERVPVDIIIGIEKIHVKDHTHYVRGGLDQILCRIAVEKEKTIAFSFAELLRGNPKLLARTKFNLKLCQKYGVKTLFSNFSTSAEELRSVSDLQAFVRVLEKNRKLARTI